MARNQRESVFPVDAELAREAWLSLTENACDLLLDSVKLEGSPRSVALLTLCLEEASKATSIWTLASPAWDREGHSRTILLKPWELRSHAVKLQLAAAMTAALGPFWGDYPTEYSTVEEDRSVAAAQNARKMAAFYVDVSSDSVSRPADLDLADYRQQVEQVAGVLEMYLIQENSRVQGIDGVVVDPRVSQMHLRIMAEAHPGMSEWEG